MLRLKGSTRVSYFTLEVDIEFKNTSEVENFLSWFDRTSMRYPPRSKQ